jgi:tetratricopeptide (TPR) repeat protein
MQTLSQPWQAKAKTLFDAGDYSQAAALYEQGIETEPDQLHYYWYLGLSYLLQDNEAEAQTTWLYVLSQGDEAQQSEWLTDLVSVLETEANQQQAQGQPKQAWLIRQHIREFEPEMLANLLALIDLSIQLDDFDPAYFEEWRLTELAQAPVIEVSSKQLLDVLDKTLPLLGPPTLEFAKACLPHVQTSEQWLPQYIKIIEKTGYEFGAN